MPDRYEERLDLPLVRPPSWPLAERLERILLDYTVPLAPLMCEARDARGSYDRPSVRELRDAASRRDQEPHAVRLHAAGFDPGGHTERHLNVYYSATVGSGGSIVSGDEGLVRAAAARIRAAFAEASPSDEHAPVPERSETVRPDAAVVRQSASSASPSVQQRLRARAADVATQTTAGLLTAAVIAAIVFAWQVGWIGADDESQAIGGGIPLTISNRVTRGKQMVEDTSLAFLARSPQNFCRGNCVILGTERASGEVIGNAVCHVIGPETTNGNEKSKIDDTNPGLATSSLWYGVETPRGRRGFINEVWVIEEQRGGLNLPRCPDDWRPQ